MSSAKDSLRQMNQVVPMLQVSDIVESLDYYQAVLGFTVTHMWPDRDNPRWIHLERDEIEIILTLDLGTSSRPFIAEKGNGVVFYIVAKDIETLYQELEEAGAIIVQDMITFGQRKQFTVADVNGYVFAFCDAL